MHVVLNAAIQSSGDLHWLTFGLGVGGILISVGKVLEAAFKGADGAMDEAK